MAREYHFYIIDNEFGDSYNYSGYFVNAAEALRFIRENLAEGNLVFTEYVDFIASEFVDWDHS